MYTLTTVYSCLDMWKHHAKQTALLKERLQMASVVFLQLVKFKNIQPVEPLSVVVPKQTKETPLFQSKPRQRQRRPSTKTQRLSIKESTLMTSIGCRRPPQVEAPGTVLPLIPFNFVPCFVIRPVPLPMFVLPIAGVAAP